MQNKKIIIIAIGLVAILLFVFTYFFSTQKSSNSEAEAMPVSTPVAVEETKAAPAKKIVGGESQKKCFQILKDDMVEAGLFDKPLEEMQKMTYQDLESQFSRTYRSLGSFGNFELDQPNVEMRVYSFGEQTGFIYPPISPYPVSTKSDVWDEPAKEFIIIEEYVVEPSGKSHFMDCALIAIGTKDPMRVTRENYLNDRLEVSLNKTAQDGSHKSSYSELLSFDRDNNPLATLRRLFVYPKSTQNEYFNKYDVADAYLAHDVESLDVLTFFLQPLMTVKDLDENGVVSEKILAGDGNGEFFEVAVPEALMPIKREGVNEIFSKSSYYQAIEARFPEFSELLSFRGSLKYDTFKDILSQPEKKQDPETIKIFSALYDYNRMTSYVLDTMANEKDGMIVTDPEMDELLAIAADGDLALQKISDGKYQIYGNNGEFTTSLYGIIAVVAIILVVLLVITVLWRKKNNQK